MKAGLVRLSRLATPVRASAKVPQFRDVLLDLQISCSPLIGQQMAVMQSSPVASPMGRRMQVGRIVRSQMLMLFEQGELVAIAKPKRCLAVIALEGGYYPEPGAFPYDRVAALRAFKLHIHAAHVVW
ncbi:hypothetical protein [Mesorhizobium sp.]|uniref:hypothetical protein n=1 Tax=Mesorhizobium sp. TaxID=1871066 RepID=UPI0025FE1155|nr:hypothetical protein [Mesorhizobium sp.]